MGCDSLLPVRWMAPESLRYTTFSTASDAWSFGVTIWEIYTFGEKPYFLQISNEDVCQKIVDGWTLDPPEQCPEIIKNIMKQCWNYQPNERYTFEDIVSMIKNSDSENTNTQTLPISQTNENYTKNGYISVWEANTPMRTPDKKSMDTYFEPSDSLENKTIKESLDQSHLLDDKTKTHQMTSIEDNPFISNGVSVGIDTNLGGLINSFNLGLDEEPSGTQWKKLLLLVISVLLVFTFISAGIAISLSSQSQGIEPSSFLGPRCLTTNTNDSPDKNAECKFPWKFDGKVINECTDATTPDGK